MPPTYFSLGLIGYPLGHSLSPRLHQAALQACGFEGEYRLYPVDPAEEGLETLLGLLHDLRRGSLQGLNVTIPHKQTVLPFMERLSPTAQAVRAVNTIVCQEGELVGENTDVEGFWADLTKKFSVVAHKVYESKRLDPDADLLPREALVLGAGGSARAVVYALCQAGWNVSLAARRVEQAKALAETFAAPGVRLSSWELSHSALSGLFTEIPVRLIVNTTPLGMSEYEEFSPWPVNLDFPGQAFVYDLVYNPAETRLLQQARLAGLEAVNGLGMLVEQALLSFELWTGVRPSVDVLYEALLG
jgi:shikimate dehydrogenase